MPTMITALALLSAKSKPSDTCSSGTDADDPALHNVNKPCGSFSPKGFQTELVLEQPQTSSSLQLCKPGMAGA